MRNQTRVKKGEKYWYIASDFFAGDFYITFGVDFYEDIQDGRFALGNYFHTKEEAETCARKILAVLKGAEVIEMPSDKEIDNNLVEHNPYHTDDGEGTLSGFANGLYNGFSVGFAAGVDWLKSKVIK